MLNVTLIKTLDHLHPLFIPKEGITVYSETTSVEIFEVLETIETWNIKNFKFSELLTKLSKIKSGEVRSDYLEKYREEVIEYKRVEKIENQFEFSVKGDIISVWLLGYEHPIRLEFFGEECESINLFDELTGRKIQELQNIIITDILPPTLVDAANLKIKLDNSQEIKSRDDINFITFTNRSTSQLHIGHLDIKLSLIQTDYVFPSLFFSNLNLLQKEIERLSNLGYKVFINSKHERDLPVEMQRNNEKIWKHENKESSNFLLQTTNYKLLTELPAGFISQSEKTALFTDREIFGTIYLSKIKQSPGKTISNIDKLLREFEGEIEIGDYVVHEDYGVALYSGLKQEKFEDVDSDFLLLKFAAEDELYVPLSQIKKITKYLNDIQGEPKLTRLGGGSWEALKQKVKTATFLTAKELIEHYAKRELSKADPIHKNDSKEYIEFVEKFKYIETPDQARSINEVLKDLEKEIPMNRLLVGDVGFGKTEVIMRAAFKVVESGGQVAILAPTTILAEQHAKTFTERFQAPSLDGRVGEAVKFYIAHVSRFNSASKNKQIIEQTNKGKVDILIGTHRLLSNDVQFKNLKLLVVDEEQKFGVKQKEKIKKLNYGAHVLSVSATPIPRTLSLALSSIQDISIITTPPTGRQSVETEIIFENWEKAANAIQKEISRGGQVYFVHNRISSISGIESKLKELIPGVKINHAHGRMSADELDRIMTDFYYQRFDVLLSTSIIENGLDLPNVNTIIIHDAHKFGLSALYQMRGRVGRSDRKAFCYLMTQKKKDVRSLLIDDRKNNPTSKIHQPSSSRLSNLTSKNYLDRLQSLVDNQDLGAGFRIASRDLELRGAGNILGQQQHGNIAAIGYALYVEMLAQEVERLRNEITN